MCREEREEGEWERGRVRASEREGKVVVVAAARVREKADGCRRC